MLVILTRPPKIFFTGALLYFVKWGLKTLLGKQRGADVVFASLKRDLNLRGINYKLNKTPEAGDTLHVISNIEALKWAIDFKQTTSTTKTRLIAGPNLVIIPTDNDSILASSEIDKIILNSEWTKEFYSRELRTVKDKISIWPAGVVIPEMSLQGRMSEKLEKDICLLFIKSVPREIEEKAIQGLAEKKIPTNVIRYGHYKQIDYFEALTKSTFMIYLQEVESQGIALQEAWARNIPTLIWNKGSFTYPTGQVVTGNIASPFLNPASGMFFEGERDFKQKLEIFLTSMHAGTFTPRQYCIDNLSDNASAEIYVKILESLTKLS